MVHKANKKRLLRASFWIYVFILFYSLHQNRRERNERGHNITTPTKQCRCYKNVYSGSIFILISRRTKFVCLYLLLIKCQQGKKKREIESLHFYTYKISISINESKENGTLYQWHISSTENIICYNNWKWTLEF